jgi:hypothetical protein
MDTKILAIQLYEQAKSQHKLLIEQARTLARLINILDFINECVNFADNYFPSNSMRTWNEGMIILNQTKSMMDQYTGGAITATSTYLDSSVVTSGSAGTAVFGYIANNYHYLEDNQSRNKFTELTEKYKRLLSSPLDQKHVHVFLSTIDSAAQSKFDHSLIAFDALPPEEDPQGPLMEMRSAIDLAIKKLLSFTPLTHKERGNLKMIEELPTIANHLSKSELAKIDLLLANPLLDELKKHFGPQKIFIFSMIKLKHICTKL